MVLYKSRRWYLMLPLWSSMEFVVRILKILLGQSFILLLPLSLFFGITGVAKVVVKPVLRSEPLHVLTVHGKVL
jgi:hypothetical protein